MVKNAGRVESSFFFLLSPFSVSPSSSTRREHESSHFREERRRIPTRASERKREGKMGKAITRSIGTDRTVRDCVAFTPDFAIVLLNIPIKTQKSDHKVCTLFAESLVVFL